MFTEAALLALTTAPPLREIKIGGRTYPLGDLDEDRRADLIGWGLRIVATERSVHPLDVADKDPSRPLRHLLLAANAELKWNEVKRHVTPAHCATAAREYLRQSVVRALAESAAAGQP